MSAQFENRFYELYLEFFNRAEGERRWNVQKDIPWHEANPNVSDEIALIVESFLAVELFLPDYTNRDISQEAVYESGAVERGAAAEAVPGRRR